jgi:hypothetical protein
VSETELHEANAHLCRALARAETAAMAWKLMSVVVFCAGLFHHFKPERVCVVKFTTLPTDGRVIAGTWYPSTWPMWLAREGNLPGGCLAPHLNRILTKLHRPALPVECSNGLHCGFKKPV